LPLHKVKISQYFLLKKLLENAIIQMIIKKEEKNRRERERY